MSWLAAFALTQAIELPFYRAALAPRPLSRALALGFVASLLTHPLVWLLFPVLIGPGRLSYSATWIVLETFAVTAEALYLRALGVRAALWWALLANAVSAGVGLALHAVL